jgi:hypothetical protein
MSQHHSVRRSYDAVAEENAGGFRDELAGEPLDRALLASRAEQAGDGAPVTDLGVRPQARPWLASMGVAVVGIDLSPRTRRAVVLTRRWSSASGTSLDSLDSRRQTASSERPSRCSKALRQGLD